MPFYVASPFTTLDTSMQSGREIHVEERPEAELTHCLTTGARLAAPGIGAWNPSFDVTPAELITGIVTEHGVISKCADGTFDVAAFVAQHQPK